MSVRVWLQGLCSCCFVLENKTFYFPKHQETAEATVSALCPDLVPWSVQVLLFGVCLKLEVFDPLSSKFQAFQPHFTSILVQGGATRFQPIQSLTPQEEGTPAPVTSNLIFNLLATRALIFQMHKTCILYHIILVVHFALIDHLRNWARAIGRGE